MPDIVCMRGLPGSGKSTVAKTLFVPRGFVRVSRDDLRQSLFNGSGILSREQEEMITSVERDTASRALRCGKSVVVDAMHLRTSYLRSWNRLALDHGAGFSVHDVHTPVNVCVARDSVRSRSVGEKVIRDLAQKFYRHETFPEYTPLVEEPVATYQARPNAPQRIIVDIDGTVALMNGRSPYAWDRVGEDVPNKPVIELVNLLLSIGVHVLFVSGRDGSCMPQTRHWLEENLTYGHEHRWELFMREAGDNRADNIVKREIFDREIRDNYNINFVLDDRDQVVKMWRSLGLTCLQVAEGAF